MKKENLVVNAFFIAFLFASLAAASAIPHTFTIEEVDAAPSQFDFSISNSGSVTVNQGSSGTNTITAILTLGTAQPVTFSAPGLPSGATSSFSNSPCSPSCSATLTISTAATTPAGTYSITASATNGTITRTTDFNLIVNDVTSPSPITDLAATSPTTTSITLTWTAPGDNLNSGTAASYDIRYSTSLITATNWGTATQATGEPAPLLAGTSQSYVVNGLLPGMTYYFAIKATDAAGNVGGLSNSPNAQTSPTVPTAPQNLQAQAGDANITLTWNAPSNNGGSAITNYSIYRGTAPGAETLLTTIGPVLTYTDTGLINGQAYYYRVSARNSAGESPQSNEASTTPQAAVDYTPIVSITNPLGGATVADTVTVVASASDDKGITKVEFYIDTVLSATDTDTPYAYAWNTKSVNNGAHTIKAMAYDTISQTNISQITVTVANNNQPTLSAGSVSPLTGDASNTYVYTIIYADPDNDAPAANSPKVHIIKSGTEITGSPFAMSFISGTYSGGATYSYPALLSAGTYTYYIEAQDARGSPIVTTFVASGPMIAPIPNPAINYTFPSTGATSVKYASTITMEFTEAMNQSSVSSAISRSPAFSYTPAWNPASTILTLTPAASLLQNTLYSVTVSTQAKSQRNVNLDSPYTFTFTTSPPLIINVISPENLPYNAPTANITTNYAAAWCDAYINGVPQHMVGTLTSWSLPITAPEGPANVSFKCADTAANEWVTSTTYFTVDRTKPVLALNPKTQTIAIQSAFINVTSSEPLSWALLEWQGANTTMAGSGANRYLTKSDLPNSNYTYRVHVADAAGNMNAISGWVYVNKTVTNYSKITFTIKDKLNSVIANALIRIYNSTGNVLSSPTGSISGDVESGGTYGIYYSLPSGESLDIKSVIIQKNITISSQFADKYAGTLPASVEGKSYVIALNDSDIAGYGSADIILPINGTVNRILHCTNWNYAGASCANWEVNTTSDYNAFVNSTHLKFTVSRFDAYMGGYYSAPAYCGDGKVDAGETCSSCPVDAGTCPPVYSPPASAPGSSPSTTPQYVASAKITSYPRKVELFPGGSYDFSITVKNTGNKSLSSMFIEIGNAWFTYNHRRIALAQGDSMTIPIRVAIPSLANTGQYSVGIALKGDATDTVFFTLNLTNSTGSASIVTFDTEAIRLGIQNIRDRVALLKVQGYNTTVAEGYVAEAETFFNNGETQKSMDSLKAANGALDDLEKSAGRREITKNFFIAYVLVGLLVVGGVLAHHYLRKYNLGKGSMASRTNSGSRSAPRPTPVIGFSGTVAEGNKRNESKENGNNDDVKLDDLTKRLEEVKKKVTGQ